MRIVYVDDSGDENQTLLAAAVLDAADWLRCLKAWLGWRKWLYRKYYLPKRYELHAQEFISGHGTIPSYMDANGVLQEPPINTSRGLRHEAYRLTLEQIARTDGLEFVTLYRGDADKMAAYIELVTCLDGLLLERGDLGIVVVDGLDPGQFRPALARLRSTTGESSKTPGCSHLSTASSYS